MNERWKSIAKQLREAKSTMTYSEWNDLVIGFAYKLMNHTNSIKTIGSFYRACGMYDNSIQYLKEKTNDKH